MNICFVVDSIEKFDAQRVILDTLISLGEGNNTIACLYMSEASITIPISLYKIESTFFSKIYKTSYKLHQNAIFSEQVAKRMKLPEADLYVVLSSGFSHHVKIPKAKTAYYYFLDLPFHLRDEDKRSAAMYKRYVQSIAKLPYKSFSSQKLGRSLIDRVSLGERSFDVIAPAFASRDFPAPSSMDSHKHQKIIINIDDIKEIDFKKLLEVYGGFDFLILTSKKNKLQLLKQHVGLNVLSSVSNHELYIELLSSCLFIDFSRHYSEKTFAALASGTPCLINKDNISAEYFTEDVVHFFDVESFMTSLGSSLDCLSGFKPEILRRFALRFNERVFKNKFFKIIHSLMKN